MADVEMTTINRLVSNLDLPSNSIFLTELVSNAIFDNCWQFVNLNLDFKSIVHCSFIISIFTPLRLHPHLIIVDTIEKSFLIINPRACYVSTNAASQCDTFLENISKLFHLDSQLNRMKDISHPTAKSLSLVNAYIYAYIVAISEDISLNDIDFHLICRNISAISIIPDCPTETLSPKLPLLTKDERALKAAEIASNAHNLSVDELIDTIYSSINKQSTKRNKPYLGNKDQSSLSKYLIRGEYTKNKKATTRKILSNFSVSACPTPDNIFNHFRRDVPSRIEWDKCPDIKSAVHPSNKFSKILCREVLSTLKRASKSTPGEDNVTYHDLLVFDPEGLVITKLFNTIRKTGTIPRCWKHFKTVLIPKPDKDNYREINNWRPIALLSTLYKIFAGIIFSRIISWVNENRLLHPFQKAIAETEGCAQHAFTITGIIEHSKSTSSTVKLAFLDIADAFGSIPHEYIFGLLERIGLHKSFVQIISNLYEDTSSVYHCNGIISPSIKINVGVKQGCPLSMLLFSLAIDPVLQSLSSPFDFFGYVVAPFHIPVLAYADDIAIISSDGNQLQTMLDRVNCIATWMGIRFRPNKCATLCIPDTNVDFFIGDSPVPKISSGESYRYLGVPIGNRNDQTPYRTLESLVKDFDTINKSFLYPWQKLDCYKTFLHSRIIFAFRTREVATRALRYNSKFAAYGQQAIAADNKIRKIFKDILSLPLNAPSGYLYGPPNLGCVGLTSLENEKDIQNITHIFNMLSADCELVSHIASECLLIAGRRRLKNHQLNKNDCLNFLNGCEISSSGAVKTLFIPCRTSILRLKKIFGISISFDCSVDEELQMLINIPDKPTVCISKSHGKSLCTVLRSAISIRYFQEMCEKPCYNLDSSLIISSRETNKIIFNGKISVQAWHFIHRARLDLLQVNDRPWVNDKKCRHCVLSETQTHVLQNCHYNMSLITERHDRCISLLIQELSSSDLIFVVDEICPFVPSGHRERIDLLTINLSKHTINMVDMKCPRDCLENFKSVDLGNIVKYSPLRKEIIKVKPDFKVELDTLVIGALGFAHPDFYKALRKLGVKNVKSLVKKMAISNIESSARIWYQHKSNHAYLYNSRKRNEVRFKSIRGMLNPNKSELPSDLLNISCTGPTPLSENTSLLENDMPSNSSDPPLILRNINDHIGYLRGGLIKK